MDRFPNNCTECEYSKTCKSYYGAKGCKHEKEIVNTILRDYKENG